MKGWGIIEPVAPGRALRGPENDLPSLHFTCCSGPSASSGQMDRAAHRDPKKPGARHGPPNAAAALRRPAPPKPRSLFGKLVFALAATAFVVPAPAHAQYRQTITNDPANCRGSGPAVRVTITEIKSSAGTIRVQLYRGTRQDWLESGRWLNRIQAPARAGSMSFCMPVPQAGTYAIAVRHDVNDNDKTDLTIDGGGMSNNPSVSIFNLGKPSHTRTAFPVGEEVKAITIRMRYM
jgi:uncharacterized protein (DUF2141 family)